MYAVCLPNGRPVLTGYVSLKAAAQVAREFTDLMGRPHHVRRVRGA